MRGVPLDLEFTRHGARVALIARGQERIVQQNLDIREYTDPEYNPMIPCTIILKPGLKIFKIYNGYWNWGHPSPQEPHIYLRGISQKHRPEWDLTNPNARERGQKWVKQKFYLSK